MVKRWVIAKCGGESFNASSWEAEPEPANEVTARTPHRETKQADRANNAWLLSVFYA